MLKEVGETKTHKYYSEKTTWWYSDFIADVNYYYSRWKWYYPGKYINQRLKSYKIDIDKVIDYLIKKNYIIPGVNIDKYNENKFVILKSHFIKLLKGKVHLDPILKLLILQMLCDEKHLVSDKPINIESADEIREEYSYLDKLFDKSEKFHWNYIKQLKDNEENLQEEFYSNNEGQDMYAKWSLLVKRKKEAKKQLRRMYYEYRSYYKTMKKSYYKKGTYPVLVKEMESFIQPYIISIFYNVFEKIKNTNEISNINYFMDGLNELLFSDIENKYGVKFTLQKMFQFQKHLSDFYSYTINNSIVNEYKEKNQIDLIMFDDDILD